MDGPTALPQLQKRQGGAPDGLCLKAETGPACFKADIDERLISGIFATFRDPSNPDAHGDVFAKGAFDQTIEEQHSRRLVKGFWKHWYLLGTCLPGDEGLQVTDEGLRATFKVARGYWGDEALIEVADEAVLHGSVGFRVTASHEEDHGSVKTLVIDEVKLFEVSPVVWPADDDTGLFKGLAAGGDATAHVLQKLDAITKALTAAGFMGAAAEAPKLAAQVVKDLPAEPTGDLLDLDPRTLADIKALARERQQLLNNPEETT